MDGPMEFDEDYKKRLIRIIKGSMGGDMTLTDAEAAILFHWVNHQDDPEYDFVPAKYRRKR